jgi:hypothetical protein
VVCALFRAGWKDMILFRSRKDGSHYPIDEKRRLEQKIREARIEREIQKKRAEEAKLRSEIAKKEEEILEIR